MSLKKFCKLKVLLIRFFPVALSVLHSVIHSVFPSSVIQLFRPFEKWGEIFLCGGVRNFFLVFDAKSGSTNNHRIGSSDIPYKSPFSRDSNGIKNFKIVQVSTTQLSSVRNMKIEAQKT